MKRTFLWHTHCFRRLILLMQTTFEIGNINWFKKQQLQLIILFTLGIVELSVNWQYSTLHARHRHIQSKQLVRWSLRVIKYVNVVWSMPRLNTVVNKQSRGANGAEINNPWHSIRHSSTTKPYIWRRGNYVILYNLLYSQGKQVSKLRYWSSHPHRIKAWCHHVCKSAAMKQDQHWQWLGVLSDLRKWTVYLMPNTASNEPYPENNGITTLVRQKSHHLKLWDWQRQQPFHVEWERIFPLKSWGIVGSNKSTTFIHTHIHWYLPINKMRSASQNG